MSNMALKDDLFVRMSREIASMNVATAQCVATAAAHSPDLHPSVLDCIRRSVSRHHGDEGLKVTEQTLAFAALQNLDADAHGFRQQAEPHAMVLRGTPYLIAGAMAQAFFVGLPDECWGDLMRP